jgi:Transposase DDE domain group 1
VGGVSSVTAGLPAVAGKPVHVAFDGGRLTSDGGILLLAAMERPLGIAERLAACIEDPRDRNGCCTGLPR